MLYRLIDYLPHSSPDPFGATLPPGEGMIPDAIGIGGTARRPFPTTQKIPRFIRNGGFSVQIIRPNTPSVSQRPVGKFYSTTVKHNPSGSNCQRRLAA